MDSLDSGWGFRICRAGAIAGCVAVPCMTVLMVAWFSLDFPYWDQWELAPLIEKAHAGNLGWNDLTAPHNEHRLLFPRLLMLGLALISRWNVKWEQVASLILAAGLCGLVLRYTVTTMRMNRWPRGLIWAASACVVVGIFSLNQWQNWSFGWQCQIYMSVLSAVAGFMLLVASKDRFGRVALAAACGCVATFSFGNGIIFWPIGGAIILMTHGAFTRRLALLLGLWTLAFLSILALNFTAYHPNPLPPGESLRSVSILFLAMIGAPLFPFSAGISICAGVAGVVAVVVLLRRHREPLGIAFILYAVGTAMLIALARCGEGTEQALSSRYISCTHYFWFGAMLLVIGQTPRRIPAVLAACAMWGLLMALGSGYGIMKWTERYEFRMEARQEVISGNDAGLLSRIHPEPGVIMERREILRRLRYNTYSE
jgi:hypothetical protein